MKSHEELKAMHEGDYIDALAASPYRLQRLLEHIDVNANSDIVDYGCGNGMLMNLLSSRVATYTGVDFSQPLIAAALKSQQDGQIRNATFHCADIHEFASRNIARFDAAFAMDFSEHVYDDEWLKILVSIRSTLKPGGTFYLHTPDGGFFLEIMKAHNFIIKQFPQHIAVRTIFDNVALLKAAGFVDITANSIPHYNILRFLHPLSYLPLFGRFFGARIFIKACQGQLLTAQ